MGKRAHERGQKEGHNQAMFAQCLLYSGPGLCRVVRDSGIYYTHTRPINRLNTFSCVFSIPAFTSFFSGSLLGLFSFLRGLRGPKVQYWLVILIPILIVDQIKKLSLCIGNKVLSKSLGKHFTSTSELIEKWHIVNLSFLIM